MCKENYRLLSRANKQPVRWTEEEWERLGNDKGFLPEAYWPSSVLAREWVKEQDIGE